MYRNPANLSVRPHVAGTPYMGESSHPRTLGPQFKYLSAGMLAWLSAWLCVAATSYTRGDRVRVFELNSHPRTRYLQSQSFARVDVRVVVRGGNAVYGREE